MNFDQILTEPATLEANRSIVAINALMENRIGWRRYTTATQGRTTSLIRRYLAAHAQIPGVYTTWMLPFEPLEIFAVADAERRTWIKGGLFSNGAVCRYHTATHPIDILWVAEETAAFWAYPDP